MSDDGCVTGAGGDVPKVVGHTITGSVVLPEMLVLDVAVLEDVVEEADVVVLVLRVVVLPTGVLAVVVAPRLVVDFEVAPVEAAVAELRVCPWMKSTTATMANPRAATTAPTVLRRPRREEL